MTDQISNNICVLAGTLTRPMPQYEQASGKGICGFEVALTAARAQELFADGRFDDVVWITTSRDRRMVYATHELQGSGESHVGAFRWDPTQGDLTYLGSRPTGGNEACHATLSSDERFLIVANYNGEFFQGLADCSLAVLPINADGSLGQATASITHVGSGPRNDRQTRAHPHCVETRPGTQDIYVADLGLDLVACYALSNDGSLTRKNQLDIRTEPGDGPRHLVFSADGARLFLVCELNPKVLSYTLDQATGAASLVDEFNIQTPDRAASQPAGIILSQSETCLFVSLRLCDQLLGLEVDSRGMLTDAGRWPCGGRTPRNIAFAGSGNNLLVANQDSSNVSLFEIDPIRGGVIRLVQQFSVGTPMCLAVVDGVKAKQETPK